MRKKGGNSQLRREPGTKSLEVKSFQVFVRTYRQCGIATVKSGELRMERYKGSAHEDFACHAKEVWGFLLMRL